MSFLGIDQSLTATGLCLLSHDGKVERLSTVDPGAALGGKRLVIIKDALQDLCFNQDITIEGAALEGYSMGSINRPFDLGEVGGVVRMVLADYDIPYTVVAPVLVKMFATGTPGATKERMENTANLAGAGPRNDNEADAFFLARIARAMLLGPDHVRCEMDAIRAIKNPSKRVVKKKLRKLVPAAI